jgi:hypothetical protein
VNPEVIGLTGIGGERELEPVRRRCRGRRQLGRAGVGLADDGAVHGIGQQSPAAGDVGDVARVEDDLVVRRRAAGPRPPA